MKFLLDENISSKISAMLDADFPGTAHLRHVGLMGASDSTIWAFAKQNGFLIVTKDEDFELLSLALGHPPKVVLLRIGNGPNRAVVHALTSARAGISHFESDPSTSLLIIS